ncbi:MAG: thiamine pyrophosphate-binding protein [Nitrososphaerota archaeon]|nr:thiamine pyrophosphate-binding protein [Nitrososphaerota archaeon]
MPTGGSLVVEGLEQGGVELTFGIPAVHNLPIYDALYGSKSVRSVPVRHEQSAGFMAIGSAYASGRPAACVVGCGPGATNLLTPVAEAYLDSVPMLAIAGGIRTSSVGRGALHDVGQLSMFVPVSKRTSRLTEPSELGNEVCRSVYQCASGRPRPIFLEVPFDVLSSEVSAAAPFVSVVPRGPEIPPGAVSSVSSILSRAERPLIIAGGGVNSAAAWEELATIAQKLSAPVASTISAKGAYPEDHALSAGQLWDEIALKKVHEADVVLALGCRFSERSTASWGMRLSGSLVHVDIDGDEIGRNYPATVGVQAGLRTFLRSLSAETDYDRSRGRQEWVDGLQLVKHERDARIERDALRTGVPIRPQRIVWEIARVLPEDCAVVAETGHAFWWAAAMLRIVRPRSFLSPSGNSTLGFGLPAALGVKSVSPGKPVLCLAGDGGFIFSCQEIATSVEEKLPVVVVVFDDRGYAAIREYQRRGYGSRYIGVDFAVQPDFVKLAESLGAEGTTVERPDDVGPTVMRALRSSKTTVVDVKISRDEDVIPKFFTEIYRRK